jgi:NAD(P)-dependent dehydrogenase (short-subunit alcohol dehydrogenase family)
MIPSRIEYILRSSSDLDEHVVLLASGTSGIGRIAATELAKPRAMVGIISPDRSH